MMEISVIVFPGSNCDRDIAVSLKKFSKQDPKMVWHKERSLPKSDLIVLPGGFSYGDYLRCGSMAANSPIMSEVIKNAKSGAYIIGICNLLGGHTMYIQCKIKDASYFFSLL